MFFYIKHTLQNLTNKQTYVIISGHKKGVIMDKYLDSKIKALGYNKIGNISKSDITQIKPLVAKINRINAYTIYNGMASMPRIELDSIINETMQFFRKYFDIHDIYYLNVDNLRKNSENISMSKNQVEAYQKYYSIMRKTSPYNIPIRLAEGHSMIGEVQKPIILIPSEEEYQLEQIPFSQIMLGNKLTKLSTSTYIHEIAHTQIESIPGSTQVYLNREVVSIFLEKLSAYEADPTGNLLKISERMRFIFWSSNVDILTSKKTDSREKQIDAMVYIQSTLLAEKLFDMYLRSSKEQRTSYIYDIQDIFNGKKTVEEILEKRDITFTNSKDLKLVLRHI